MCKMSLCALFLVIVSVFVLLFQPKPDIFMSLHIILSILNFLLLRTYARRKFFENRFLGVWQGISVISGHASDVGPSSGGTRDLYLECSLSLGSCLVAVICSVINSTICTE